MAVLDDALSDLRRTVAALEQKLEERTAERDEALAQRTATSEILRVISCSPADVQPVFEAIVASAARVCEAEFSAVARLEEGFLDLVAVHSLSPEETAAFHSLFPRPLARNFAMGQAFLDAEPVHFEDVLTDLDYDPHTLEVLQSVAGYRSFLAVPIFRQGGPIGVVGCGRREVKPFTATQIELLETFADQAAIAIENVRLFNELETRNRDVSEALDQQTATAEVLQVINSSPGNLAPVFDAMLGKAMRLCEATCGYLLRYQDGNYFLAAGLGLPAELEEYLAHMDQPRSGEGNARVLQGEPYIRLRDLKDDEAYRSGAPLRRMENARLITETCEALEQQTATAEVLQVINSSPGDLAPVFDAILEKAHSLCGIAQGSLELYDGERFRAVAVRGLSDAFADMLRRGYPASDNPATRPLIEGGRFTYIRDLAETEYSITRSGAQLEAVRTLLCVPLRRDDVLLGMIASARREVRPFSKKEITLLENFAAQAVIAMENARLITETREALEQQTATAEVLQIINSSPGDLVPVFEAILDKAHTLCGATRGTLFLFDGETFRAAVTQGYPEDFANMLRQGISGSQAAFATLVAGSRLVHIPDLTQIGDPVSRAVAERGGVRTNLLLPLRKDDTLLGVISCNRGEVRPFSEKEIALLQNFAAQAVIAMENARLLDELRQRTHDLQESLDYQTATSDVLKVISRSTFNLQPVLETVAETAARLCDAEMAFILRRDGEVYRAAAAVGFSSEYQAFMQAHPIAPGRGSITGRVALEGRTVQIADVAPDPEYTLAEATTLGQQRTALGVPLMRENVPIGVIVLARTRVEPFTEKQIELVTTFADQAVIAIENARLLNELRDRTHDLQESLEYQTATSDVLKVISRSTFDLQPVLETVAETAARLCEAGYSAILRRDGEVYRMAAAVAFSPETLAAARQYQAFLEEHPLVPGRGSVTGRVALAGRPVHIIDCAADPEYTLAEATTLGKLRTQLGVPLLREGSPIGVICLGRQHVEPFTEKQIELVTTFADQAVIAIENARLLNELRDRTDELMQREAELRVTFDNMADGVVMFDGDMRLAAWNRNFQQILHLPDALLVERLNYADYFRHLAERGEFGAVDVDAELRRYQEHVGRQWSSERTRPDGRVIEVRNNPVPGGGLVLIYSDITERKEAEAWLRAARDAAEATLRELRTAQASLIHAEKMASLGQLTAGIAHEIKNPLNFVNNFAGLSVELLDELKEAAAPVVASLGDDVRSEIDEIVGMLTGNLEKIAEHGRRADGIVKSMLAHSRGGNGERQCVDINSLVDESLNLAYHGARAQDQNFNITLERDLDRSITPIELVPQDVTRVFLNLFGNGFYAACKRNEENDRKFKPTLTVTTRDLGAEVEIRVRDNGTGIPSEIGDKLFQPFFTTKPTGEGTGLGLSISYDIVTQQHGGTITVDSRIGEFTEFTVRLPRRRHVTTTGRAT